MNTASKTTFNADTHTYSLDGKIVPSVTQIIAEITGHGWQAAEWYLQRGRATHACAAFIAQGKDFKYDDRIAGEVTALRKFFKEVNPIVYGQEIMVVSPVYLFAGTEDLSCKIVYDSLIDWKHSLDKIRTPIQLGGYSQAHKETFGVEINFGYGVEIHANGTYKMTERINLKIPRMEFLALRTAYRVKERCGNLTTQQKGNENA